MKKSKIINPREELPTDLLEEYIQAFSSFTQDEESTINLDKLSDIMKGLFQNPTESELKDMIREVDENGDGEIDLDEFLLLMAKKSIDPPIDDYREAFKLFDIGKTGNINCMEIKRIFDNIGNNLSVKECQLMIKEVSKTGMGINFSDFANLMQKQSEESKF